MLPILLQCGKEKIKLCTVELLKANTMEPTVFDNDDEKFTNVIFKTRHKYMEFIYMSNYNLIDGFQF